MVSGILWSEYYRQALEVEQLLQEIPYTENPPEGWWEKRSNLLAELDYLLEQLVITYNQWILQHYSTEEDQI